MAEKFAINCVFISLLVLYEMDLTDSPEIVLGQSDEVKAYRENNLGRLKS